MAYVPNLQIENGGFTDFEGNPLALGYLLMQLSHDECYAIGPNQVVGGLKLTINLNSTGNIPTSPATLVWSNDVLTPSGSYYIVRAFKADGTEAWASPQYWTLAASPDPLDVGGIVPTNPPGSGLSGGGSTLLLETNGTVNTNQALLNLTGSGSITVSNSAGTTTIGGGGVAFSTSGQGGFWSAGFESPATFGRSVTNSSTISTVADRTTAFQFTLLASYTIRTVSCFVSTTQSSTSNFGIYSASGNRLLDSGAISMASPGAVLSTLGSPVVLGAGVYYFAQSSHNTGAQVAGFSLVSDNLNLAQALASGVYVGIATNSTVGGVMPATLGVINNATYESNPSNMAAAFFGV